MRDIVRIGREHLAAVGPTALSLRAIARDLGVVSSAVYRYVASRDELLTLLIVDAYDELGDAVEAGIVASGEDPRERFMAVARAVRSWAIAEPSRYALVFGTPVPGYEAPGERTTGPGTRVILALLRIFDDAARTGRLAAAELTIDPDLGADLSRIREEYGSPLEDAQFIAATIAWTGIFGAVSFEVFGQYGHDTFTAPSALFEAQMEALAAGTGLT